MQKEFDLIVERLEEETYDMEICEEQFDMNSPYFMDVPYKMVKMDDVKEIVKQVAEEYKSNDGWIPCSERLPERNKQVLCWAKSTARGGDVCFTGSCDNGAWFLQTAVDTLSYPTQYEVVAWRELPQPYQPKEITKDCNTCANHTEPEEVDNGCYMCCKGLENNYEPKGEEDGIRMRKE